MGLAGGNFRIGKALGSVALVAVCGCFGEVSGGANPPPDVPGASGDSGATTDGGAAAGDAGNDAGQPADAGASLDGGAASDGGQDAGVGPRRRPVFMAQGAMGRTTLSCDDGRTWVGNRSWDVDGDALTCGQVQSCTCYTGTCRYQEASGCVQVTDPCNHTSDAAKGLAYGNGTWVATWGWGRPGAIRSSVNGVDWVTRRADDQFGGLAFGSNRFVAASRFPYTSVDGLTWDAGALADFRARDGVAIWSVRKFTYADVRGGRFIAIASGDTDRDVLISADQGASWRRPTSLPAGCAQIVSDYGGIVSGNGVMVIVDHEGTACRSTDGGDTWAVAATGAREVLSHGVWTGSEFQFWADDKDMIRSPDGLVWTKTPLTSAIRLGPVARSPSGTYVALGSVWQGYAQQQFFRSTDGLSWTALPPGAFTRGHPIFYLAYGEVEASTVCP